MWKWCQVVNVRPLLLNHDLFVRSHIAICFDASIATLAWMISGGEFLAALSPVTTS